MKNEAMYRGGRATALVVAVALASSLSCSCARTAASGSERLSAQRNRADNDPLERVNRKIFWFNDKVDVYALEPVATGWDKIAPDPVQRSLSNFFTNLRFPIVAVNNLLQGKVAESASDVGRFGVNVTFGALGFFDPASSFGLARHSEDFGQTLGWWGVPPGPYLVLPLLGPSNPRDAGGRVADYAASVVPFFVNQWILFGARMGDSVNARSLVLKEVRDAKQASLDYYTFVRNAYFQHREALVNDSTELTHKDEKDLYDLYDPDLAGAGDADE